MLLGVLLLMAEYSRGDPYFEREFNKCLGVCPFYNNVKEVERMESCLKVSEVQGDEAREALVLPKDLKGLATFVKGLAGVPRVQKECKMMLNLAEAILRNATKENEDKNNCNGELADEKGKVLHYSNSSQFWEEKAESRQQAMKQLFDGFDQVLEIPTGVLNLSFAERGATTVRTVKELKSGFVKAKQDLKNEQRLRIKHEQLAIVFNSSANGLREELEVVKANLSSTSDFWQERFDVLEKNATTTLTTLQSTARELNTTSMAKDECLKDKGELKEVVDQQRKDLTNYDVTMKGKDERIAKAENASLTLNASLAEALILVESKTQRIVSLEVARDEAIEDAAEEERLKEECNNATVELKEKVEKGEKCAVDKKILKNERDNLLKFKGELEKRAEECYEQIPIRDQEIDTLERKLNESKDAVADLQGTVVKWQREAAQKNVSYQEALETIKNLNESLKLERAEKTKVQESAVDLAENATSSTRQIAAMNATNRSQQERIVRLNNNITEGIEEFLEDLQALNETNSDLEEELDNKNATLIREARSLVSCKERRNKLDKRVKELQDFEDKYEEANDQLDVEIANRKDRGVSDKTLENGTAWRYLTSNKLTLLTWIGCMAGCYVLGVITTLCCTCCRCKIRRRKKGKPVFSWRVKRAVG